MKVKNKEKNKSMKVVVFAFVFTTIYVVINIIMTRLGYPLDSTLTEWVFKFYGLELIALSGIKVSKNVGSAFGKLEDAINGACYDDDNVE